MTRRLSVVYVFGRNLARVPSQIAKLGEWYIFDTPKRLQSKRRMAVCPRMPCEREFAICLSGGSTTRRLYQRLAEEIIESRFPWKHVHWFWGDERFVLHDDPGSDYRMAYDALFSRSPPRLSCDRGEQEKNSGKNSRWRYQDPAGRICPIGNLFWFVDRAAMSS